jgi:hypothetical protein
MFLQNVSSYIPAEQCRPFPVLTVQAAASECISEVQLHLLLLLLLLQCTRWHSRQAQPYPVMHHTQTEAAGQSQHIQQQLLLLLLLLLWRVCSVACLALF